MPNTALGCANARSKPGYICLDERFDRTNPHNVYLVIVTLPSANGKWENVFRELRDNLAQIKFQHFIKIVCAPVAQQSNLEMCLKQVWSFSKGKFLVQLNKLILPNDVYGWKAIICKRSVYLKPFRSTLTFDQS